MALVDTKAEKPGLRNQILYALQNCKTYKTQSSLLFQAILRLQQITANARKHTWFFYQVVRKTSLQSVQEIKISLHFQAILRLQQITANARKHTWYFYQVVQNTSLQSVQEIKISLHFQAILRLQQITANARKHTWYF